MHCSALQRIATHYNTLQHTATHCNILQHTATPCNNILALTSSLACLQRLGSLMKRGGVRQHMKVKEEGREGGRKKREKAANRVSVCVCVRKRERESLRVCVGERVGKCLGNGVSCINLCTNTATHCNKLRHTATHCDTLQHTATECNSYTYLNT